MMPVWDVIEDAGLPVTHHIGETPPKSPCEFNSVAVAMMINVDSFRDMFARYIFSGILDRHPKLRIGWFEGGIAWIPPALQDAEHVLASYQHMLNHQLEHDIRYYWDTHMCASFMVDPLGLQAHRRDRRRQGDVVVGLPAQREHVRLLGEVAGRRRRRGRARERRARSSAATSRTSWASMTTPTRTVRHRHSRPAGPRTHVPRDRRPAAGGDGRPWCGRADPVGTATSRTPPAPVGRCSMRAVPRRTAGRGRAGRRRTSAPVHAVPRGHRIRVARYPPTIVHGPLYLEFDEGVEHFARVDRRAVTARRDGRGRRADRRDAPGARTGCSPGAPWMPRRWSARPSWSRRSTRSRASERRAASPKRRSSKCRRRWRPGSAKSTCRPVRAAGVRTRRDREHARGDLAGDAELARRRRWTTHGDLALPLLTTERELAAAMCCGPT